MTPERVEIADHLAGGIDEALINGAPKLPGAFVVCVGASRSEWLEHRKPFYGGSDVAAVLEIEGAWGSRRSVFQSKTGHASESEETGPMRAGNMLEQAIAEWFSEDSGIQTMQPTPITMYASRDLPLAAASPDRLQTDGLGVAGWVEIKNVGAHRAPEWAPGAPAHYQAQMLWQLGVSGLDDGWLVVLIGGQDLRWFHYARDAEWFERAYEAVEQFHSSYVLTGVEPEPDGSEATKRALNAEFAESTPEPFEGGYVLAAAVAELIDAQEAERVTKARLTKAENAVKLLLREHEVGTCDGGEIVTWKTTRREAYSVEASEYRRLFVPKGARAFFSSLEEVAL